MNKTISYQAHEAAIIEDNCQIGTGTKIWHFSHIMAGSSLGEHCTIGQNVVISPGVILGNQVKVQNNVSVYTGVTCEDDGFLGPSVVFTNIRNPRSALNWRDQYVPTLVKKGATLGANSTLLGGIIMGKYDFVGAGSVILKSVLPFALVYGNSARQQSWVCASGHRLNFNDQGEATCPHNKETYP